MAKRFALGVDITNVKTIDIHKVIQVIGKSDNVTELWLLTSNPTKIMFPIPKTIPTVRTGSIYRYPSIQTAILELSEDGGNELEVITAICATGQTQHPGQIDIGTTQPFQRIDDSNYLSGGYTSNYPQYISSPNFGSGPAMPIPVPLALSELCAEFKIHTFLSGSDKCSMFFGEKHPTKLEYVEALSEEHDDLIVMLDSLLTSF